MQYIKEKQYEFFDTLTDKISFEKIEPGVYNLTFELYYGRQLTVPRSIIQHERSILVFPCILIEFDENKFRNVQLNQPLIVDVKLKNLYDYTIENAIFKLHFRTLVLFQRANLTFQPNEEKVITVTFTPMFYDDKYHFTIYHELTIYNVVYFAIRPD